MTTLSDYDQPFDQVGERVLAWVKEALELRHGAGGDPLGSIRDAPTDTIEEIQNLLLRVRARSDRVDELLNKSTQAKYRAKRAQQDAAFAAANAVDRATSARASKRQQEFESGRERMADANLEAFEERRIAHQAERLVSVTTEGYEVIHGIHWQLDAIRKDLRAHLHALQFESSLER